MSTRGLRAVIYCRISKDRFAEQLGVRRQEKDCRALCERNGWDVVEVIVDNDTEASSGRPRPGYERMLEMMKAQELDAVVAWDLDRLVRRPAQLEDFFEVADAAGMSRLATIGDKVDPTTGDGVLVARIKGAVAAEEVRKLGQRARRKHLELAERGRPSGGGFRCFGYGADGIALEETEAEALREACDAYLAGEPVDSICRRWNTSRIRTTAGGEWRGQTLRNLLRSPRIAGLRAHRGEVVGDAAWPAIVDRDTWERVQAKFRANAGRAPTIVRCHLLTGGLVCCAKCGHPMTTAPVFGVGKYRCEKRPGKPNCGGMTVSIDPVDGLVTAMVLFRLNSPAMATAMQRGSEHEADRSAATEIANGESKLEELATTWATGEITRAEWMTARKAIEARIAAARSRLARDDRRAAVIGLAAGGVSLTERWLELPLGRQRAVIAAIVDRVMIRPAAKPGSRYFDPERVEVIWRV